MTCPFENPVCRGKACGNFNDPTAKFGNPDLTFGCKGDSPTAAWSRWYTNHDFNSPTAGRAGNAETAEAKDGNSSAQGVSS